MSAHLWHEDLVAVDLRTARDQVDDGFVAPCKELPAAQLAISLVGYQAHPVAGEDAARHALELADCLEQLGLPDDKLVLLLQQLTCGVVSEPKHQPVAVEQDCMLLSAGNLDNF